MKKTTVIRGEHEHAVQLQGSDPVAQSKRSRTGGPMVEAELVSDAKPSTPSSASPRRSAVLPKPRPTPKAPPAVIASRDDVPATSSQAVLPAGSILSPEETWDADSQVLQRLTALKFKNSQLSAHIQRLRNQLPGKGSES